MILAQGGNAVDSAITTALCQGILSPAASGLGGGHFMVIRSPNGTTEVIDAREVAPAAATENMFKGVPYVITWLNRQMTSLFHATRHRCHLNAALLCDHDATWCGSNKESVTSSTITNSITASTVCIGSLSLLALGQPGTLRILSTDNLLCRQTCGICKCHLVPAVQTSVRLKDKLRVLLYWQTQGLEQWKLLMQAILGQQ